MNVKQIAKIALPWAFGLAGGAAVTYGVLRDKYMMLTVDELENILRESIDEAMEELNTPSEEDEDTVDDIGRLAYFSGNSDDFHKHSEDLVKVDEISKFQGYLEENEPASPSDERTSPVPMVISAEEYIEENGHTKREMRFLKGVNALLDENDEIISESETSRLIGPSLISYLSLTEDNAYVYICNDAESVDFEIEILDREESEYIVQNIQ